MSISINGSYMYRYAKQERFSQEHKHDTLPSKFIRNWLDLFPFNLVQKRSKNPPSLSKFITMTTAKK